MGMIIQCNKWRPYYYDMFNRVGNLTLLSLSRRRNSIIESLHTFTHENRRWQERLNLRFPEEEQSDFASLRIYWKYQAEEDVPMDEPGEEHKGPPAHKSYFLFHNNRVQEVERHDFSKIRKFINRRLEEHQGQTLAELSVPDRLKSEVPSARKTYEQFWLL